MTVSIVVGAAGFIGRAVVEQLLKQGGTVTAALRPGSENRLAAWLESRAVDQTRLHVVACDITAKDLGLPAELDTSGIHDVYNCAARFAFGLDKDDAYAVNVTGALNVLDWATELPALRRVVHITGYRVTVEDPGEQRYERGAYEASKVESDPMLRRRAAERGIPLTIANPSSVLGPGQYVGLASIVADLWHGRLVAIPGGRETFLPIVDLDYFATFLTALPSQDDTVGRSFTVLDPRTPVLPDLIRLLARHLGVRAPHFSIPVSVIQKLPRALTGADPESLPFIADDRYDTTAAEEVARRAGITMPHTETVLRAWADHLVSSRFGAVEADPTAGFVDGTWVSGDRENPEYVLLHGLPVDSDSWAAVRAALEAPSLVADLPGLGRSAPGDIDDVLPRLMSSVRSRPVLVGHSLGCGPVLRYAAAHPERIAGVVLVSPAFLQQPTGRLLRSPLTAVALRRMSAAALAARLGIPIGPATDAATNLRRPRVAARTVAALRRASAPARRHELTELLAEISVPVRIVVGAEDPLSAAVTSEPIVIEGTGHYPQLTHPARVAAEIARLDVTAQAH
ncbi:alpha/beta fold hydrolase [Nocardia ninae]|uniref:Bifunctional protein n=1 Tax=Nocardia ninae NBRC 108245 TaxID=1210091 RepID=A0A511MP53_9NOCA|nr:alpha/beta fold hydrolase [Nocardia ninae]GEM42241.1 bifunctional protein [Nocardia ninae NBRC 108245]